MPFGLYLHFPFCRNHCSYCDFYKEIYDRKLETEFYDALRCEVDLAAEDDTTSDRTISTIFVGGGTPSLANLERFRAWLEQLRSRFNIPEGIEFSIENNPESVNEENLGTFRQLGVNRPVFGIQSFHVNLLSLLNRRHNPDDSVRSVALARRFGYTNFGVDLIFGLPGQTLGMLMADIEQIIEIDPPHISFYQLTVEPGTDLARLVASDSVNMPDQELALAMYRDGCERMFAAGYRRYEVSSFAKPGFECRHNIGYWDGSDYLALGPSGHSFINGQRFANSSSVADYIRELSAGRRPLTVDQSGSKERIVEAIMLGLRTTKGVERNRFALRFDREVEELLDRRQCELFLASGHLISDSVGLHLSDEGMFLADEITRRLIL